MTPELWARLTALARPAELRDCPDCGGVGYLRDDDEHPCHECSGSGGVPAEWRYSGFGPLRVEVRGERGGAE